jgi:hypothetical protein
VNWCPAPVPTHMNWGDSSSSNSYELGRQFPLLELIWNCHTPNYDRLTIFDQKIHYFLNFRLKWMMKTVLHHGLGSLQIIETI